MLGRGGVGGAGQGVECVGVFLDAIDDSEGLRPGKDKAQVFQEYLTPKHVDQSL